jgi:iron complex transport system substrate-binding protein
VIKPDVILADLVKIFHPGLLPDHEFYYYQKIGSSQTEESA